MKLRLSALKYKMTNLTSEKLHERLPGLTLRLTAAKVYAKI